MIDVVSPKALETPLKRLTIPAGQVALLLGISEDTFRNKRVALEAQNFPKKLPGLNAWSHAAVIRWITTNGETFLPDAPAHAPGEAVAVPTDLAADTLRLERKYGGLAVIEGGRR